VTIPNPAAPAPSRTRRLNGRRAHEVSPGVFAIHGLKTGRSYIVEDAAALTLIDTSTGDVAARILEAIAEIGHRPEDLRTIVATHYHHDHTGNVAALVERTGATFCVHADDVPYVDGRAPWMPLKPPFSILDRFGAQPYSLRIDRVLRDGDVIESALDLKVIHAPGHTPGHIALHSPRRRVLLAGDALMNTLGLRLPLAMSSHDMDAAKQSARRLAELDFDVALPGHGNPILSEASVKIAEWVRAWV
jgi:glyoxylase-like metal-dependent hydrolase (beta-lactamase superfamily II)